MPDIACCIAVTIALNASHSVCNATNYSMTLHPLDEASGSWLQRLALRSLGAAQPSPRRVKQRQQGLRLMEMQGGKGIGVVDRSPKSPLGTQYVLGAPVLIPVVISLCRQSLFKAWHDGPSHCAGLQSRPCSLDLGLRSSDDFVFLAMFSIVF